MTSKPEHLPRVLILNAALNGAGGNTAVLLTRAAAEFGGRAEVSECVLASGVSYADVRRQLEPAQAILVGTGTHWDSWSHLLQRFLEEATPGEATALWLGKPAGVVVTMHSVGGKAVLSRLQGVLNTLGCLIPPMSGLVYSAVNQAALREHGPTAEDIWSPDDLAVLCHNLLVPLTPGASYCAWSCDRRNFTRRWIA